MKRQRNSRFKIDPAFGLVGDEGEAIIDFVPAHAHSRALSARKELDRME